MEYGLSDKKHYADIANAIREKNGTDNTYKPSEMAEAIKNISTAENKRFNELLLRTISGKVVIPDGVVRIPTELFTECDDITEVIMSNTVTSIGASAFKWCSNLTTVVLSENITTISASLFDKCGKISSINIPPKVTSILTNALTKLRIPKLRLPPSIQTISSNAFSGGSMKEVIFEGTPTSIYANAFGLCGGLTTIKVPWSEGEVANAPWGAVNATIIYNYTEDEE